MNRYSPSHFSQVNRALNGVYYIASQHSECSPGTSSTVSSGDFAKAFVGAKPAGKSAAITTGTARRCRLPESVDYVFTDPPFGENIFYADLNFLVEAWHRVRTDATTEAIIDRQEEGAQRIPGADATVLCGVLPGAEAWTLDDGGVQQLKQWRLARDPGGDGGRRDSSSRTSGRSISNRGPTDR